MEFGKRIVSVPATITLIVVSYNGGDQLRTCLESVGKGLKVPTSIVVVENGDEKSARAVEEILREIPIPNQVIHCSDNPGYAAAINKGFEAMPGSDAFWILNPDTEVSQRALRALASTMSLGFDIVGGRIIDRAQIIQSDGGLWRAWSARAVSLNKGKNPSTAGNEAYVLKRMRFVSGASFLARGSAIGRIGKLRGDYFLYAEEVEWCVRALAEGCHLGFNPDAVVIHDQGGSTGSGVSIRTRPKLPIFLDERNKLNVVRDTSPAWLPVATVVSLILLLVRYGKCRAWRQLSYAAQGWAAGVLGQRGKPPWMAADGRIAR